MKKLLFILLFALPFPLFAQTAKIKIDIEGTLAEIYSKVYGVFMEPIQIHFLYPHLLKLELRLREIGFC